MRARAGLASGLLVLTISGCSLPLGRARTPLDVLAAADTNFGQVRSYRFEFRNREDIPVPKAFRDAIQKAGYSLPAALAGPDMVLDMDSVGTVVVPDRASWTATAQITGRQTYPVREIKIGTHVYVWRATLPDLAGSAGWVDFSSRGASAKPGVPRPLEWLDHVHDWLRSASAVENLGDTTRRGVAVHHYRFTNPPHQHGAWHWGTTTVEAWIGRDDDLPYGLASSTTLTFNYGLELADYSGLLGDNGSGFTTNTVPDSILATADNTTSAIQAELNAWDYNANISVTPPPTVQ